jgi:hypothetical protein
VEASGAAAGTQTSSAAWSWAMKRRKRNLLLPTSVQGIRTSSSAHVEATEDL